MSIQPVAQHLTCVDPSHISAFDGVVASTLPGCFIKALRCHDLCTMPNTSNDYSPQPQISSPGHITWVIHPSSGPIMLNLNVCLTCASTHHNLGLPDILPLTLAQLPLESTVAPIDSNSETEPDSAAEDLIPVAKPTLPASDSATETDSGAEDYVPIVKKEPDVNQNSKNTMVLTTDLKRRRDFSVNLDEGGIQAPKRSCRSFIH
ncbi:uncharacterized protein LACBIDRAFT_314574 [Laccaria bicolor S238N-H82]|uniref:Predicted protein n=1 Tax=Laccaria bicolor (strain S238N-H82 / ATCC MYA-4686) TaxID=486041 RepID=B0DYU1_LACBS|nr:uncharacterized protein LACBIDRAFT_314574 [Laccaria bicolor S238N-H82]EDR00232.1 predicted protein [Laccaria bicolor S238N-H82]|eukprot:XP_001889141.1 predicted protein [Laccaria bicolor S238N-H82]